MASGNAIPPRRRRDCCGANRLINRLPGRPPGGMMDTLEGELERFAAALIDAQQTLRDILSRKRAALTCADATALAELQGPEAEAAQRLQVLAAWRSQLLRKAHDSGRRVGSLTELAGSLVSPIVETLERARRQAAEIQQETWVQWVIIHRCCSFYGDVVEMIAQGGRKSPTYHQPDLSRSSSVVLDACA